VKRNSVDRAISDARLPPTAFPIADPDLSALSEL
jgi:hypothetical protein